MWTKEEKTMQALDISLPRPEKKDDNCLTTRFTCCIIYSAKYAMTNSCDGSPKLHHEFRCVMEQCTQHVKGQFNGQVTATTQAKEKHVATTERPHICGRSGCMAGGVPIGRYRHPFVHGPSLGATELYRIHAFYADALRTGRREPGGPELDGGDRRGALRTVGVDQRRRLAAVGRRHPDRHNLQSYRTHRGHDLLLLGTRC